MSTNENKTLPDDEIDFGRLGNKTGQIIAYPFRLLLKHPAALTVALLLGIATAFGLRHGLTEIYSASFMIRPSDMTDKMYMKVLGDLPALVKQKDYGTLSEVLNLDEDSLNQIEKLQLSHYSYRVGPDSSYYSEILIESQDPSQMIGIQNAILNWLENNPYYSRIRNLQKSQITMGMQQVDSDLPMLDSLKQLQLELYQKSNRSGGDLATASMMNPAAVYTVSAERLEKKAKLMGQTEFLNRFNLLKRCVVPKYPGFPPRLLVLLLITIPAFLLLTAFFLHIRTARQQ